MVKRLIGGGMVAWALVAAFWSGTVSAAEFPRGKWWKDAGIARELNLTSGEVQQLDNLYANRRHRLIELKHTVEKEQSEYQNLIEKKNLDEAAVRSQFQKLEQARTRLSEERSRFIMEIRKILGHERFQALKEIYRRYQ
ncbi:MAG: Spy/CpxP family protein refolding chaperone [Desulfobacterales bacterium]